MIGNFLVNSTQYITLTQLSTKILGINSFEEFQQQVVSHLKYLLDFHRFTLSVKSSTSKGFELIPLFDARALSDSENTHLLKSKYLDELTGAVKACYEQSSPITSNRVTINEAETVYNDQHNKGLQSFICCPINLADKKYGVVTIAHKEMAMYSHQDVEILNILASWIASSMERWSLFESLKFANQSLQTNQSELFELSKRLNKERKALEQTKLKLEQSNIALANFAHIASHDLQEPLNNIINLTELLKLKIDEGNPELVKKVLIHINNGTKQMKQFIRDLLSFSKVDADLGSLEIVDSQEVVSVVLKNLGTLIEKNKAKVEIETSLPKVKGHATLVGQLFLNLVGNALKYRSAQAPIVFIGAEKREDSKVEFYVKDNGKGISKEFHQKIFEIFQRAESDITVQGTGIGLSTCKKIVDRYKGKIWVDSELNKGSCFRFTLPAVD